jgi:hypothetical protein
MEGDRREEGTCCGLVKREDAQALSELPDELRVAVTEIAAAAREGLLAMSVAVGLRVMDALLQAERRPRRVPGASTTRRGPPTGTARLLGRWCWAAGGCRSIGSRPHP